MSVFEWSSFVKVRRILLKTGCIIFGGAVRDSIYHTFQATEFCKERDEHHKKHPNEDFNYDDKIISVNTLGRFTIPSDIDAFVYEDTYIKLITHLQKVFPIKIKSVKDLKYFAPDVEEGIYKLYKIEVNNVEKKGPNSYNVSIVKLDLVVCPNDRNKSFPLIEVDFNVNALFQSESKDIYVSPNHEKCNDNRAILLYNIMSDIKQHIARGTSCNILPYRINKLIKKGWEVLFRFKIYNFYNTRDVEEGETCIICTANKSEFIECVNFRLCTCKSVICMTCMLSNYNKLHKCPTCREKIIHDEEDTDSRLNELTLHNKYMPFSE